METVEPGSDYDTSEAESDSEEAPAQSSVQQEASSLDENQDTSNMLRSTTTRGGQTVGADTPRAFSGEVGARQQRSYHVPGSDCGTPKAANGVSLISQAKQVTVSATASVPKRRKRHGAPMQEGTYIGGGRRMMCYCPKHSHMAQTPQAIAQQNAIAPAASMAAAEYVPSKAVAVQPAADQRQERQQSRQQARDTVHGLLPVDSGQPVPTQLAEHGAGCIRGLPFNHACRRGQREPDAIAAALAKRLFVAKTPYIIGEAKRHASQHMPLAQVHTTEQPFLHTTAFHGTSTMPSRCQPAAKTQTQRFKEMQLTLGQRVTCGKSAIHGLGAFTKQPHKPGKRTFVSAVLSCAAPVRY